jgi:uncharacterized membrane protein (UPF0127 family)
MNPFGWIYKRLRDRLAARTPATPDARMRVANLTRHTLLATQLEVADSAPKRSKGLLGRKLLAPGEGMWIVPCESIHTFAMKFPIDLVYLDRNHRIKKVKNAVPPWRLSACLSAHSILELPAGAIRNTQTQAGDQLEFSPAPAPGSAVETRALPGEETAQ